METSYYVYLVRCADDTLYCGYTTCLEKRLQMHNSGKGAKYTKSRLPVELVYFERMTNKSDALRREHAIKQLTKQQKLLLIQQKRAD